MKRNTAELGRCIIIIPGHAHVYLLQGLQDAWQIYMLHVICY